MAQQTAGWFERTSDDEPLRSALSHYNAARDASEHLNFEAVQSECRKALQLVPEMPEALNALASIHSQQSHWLQSLQTLQRSVQSDPTFAKGWCNLALVQARTDSTSARDSAERAIVLCPEFSHAWSSLGHAEETQNDREAALAAYSRAIELDPAHSDHYCRRAMVYWSMARTNQRQPQPLGGGDGKFSGGIAVL